MFGDERLPPTPVRPRKRLAADKIGSYSQCTSSPGPAWACLASKVPLRPLHFPSLQNDSALLSAPHLSAWSHTRRRDWQQQGELSAQGLFASAAAREHRSEECKGSSDSAFITAQSNKAVA